MADQLTDRIADVLREHSDQRGPNNLLIGRWPD